MSANKSQGALLALVFIVVVIGGVAAYFWMQSQMTAGATGSSSPT